MARFGESFLSAMTRPSFGEGLFTAGVQAGATPGRMAQRQVTQNLQKEIIEARLSGDPARLKAVAQKAAQAGDTQTATLLTQEAVTASQTAANAAKLNVFNQAVQAIPDITTEEGRRQFFAAGAQAGLKPDEVAQRYNNRVGEAYTLKPGEQRMLGGRVVASLPKEEDTGEWKALGGNSNARFNTKTGEVLRLTPSGEDVAEKDAETAKEDAKKSALIKVVENKYRYAPAEIKDAMISNIEAGIVGEAKDLKEILSDDELKRVVTPSKQQQIITDSQGEIRKVRDLRKTVEEGFAATGLGSTVAGFFSGSSASTARTQIQSIQASQAFKSLLDIKANNATLGQVSNVELNLLINEVEALSQDMDDETFLQALDNIEQRYINLIKSMNGEMQTVPMEGNRQAYLSSTNKVRVVEKGGTFQDYSLQQIPNDREGRLALKMEDGIFIKDGKGNLVFTPKELK